MKKQVLVFLCILSMLMVGGSALAQSPLKFEFSFGPDYMMGDTTYQIGGKVYDQFGNLTNRFWFPISELEFPTDVMMATAALTVGSATDSWRINTSLSKNVTEDAGTMKDSDWVTNPNTLDIYSESDADLDALAFDINADYRFFQRQNFALYAGVGFRRHDYDFDVKNMDQWYPSGLYGSGHEIIPGKVLTYEVDFNLAYLTLGSQVDLSNLFHLYAEIGYAYAKSTDEDNHLLRDRVSKGDYDGNAVLFNLAARFDLNPEWFLTGKIDYQHIEVDGESDTYESMIKTHSIYQEIESQQTTLSVAIGYRF